MVILSFKIYLLLIFFMSICSICAVNIYFAENTIDSLISLLCCVVFASCSLLLFRVEFLSFAYILVYGGAVVVLFLFVILSSDLRKEDTWRNKTRLQEYKISNFLVFILFFIFSLLNYNFKNIINIEEFAYSKDYFYINEFLINDIFIFSKFFYTHFFIFFVLLGILLLISMVGSIALCMKHLQKY